VTCSRVARPLFVREVDDAELAWIIVAGLLKGLATSIVVVRDGERWTIHAEGLDDDFGKGFTSEAVTGQND